VTNAPAVNFPRGPERTINLDRPIHHPGKLTCQYMAIRISVSANICIRLAD